MPTQPDQGWTRVAELKLDPPLVLDEKTDPSERLSELDRWLAKWLGQALPRRR